MTHQNQQQINNFFSQFPCTPGWEVGRDYPGHGLNAKFNLEPVETDRFIHNPYIGLFLGGNTAKLSVVVISERKSPFSNDPMTSNRSQDLNADARTVTMDELLPLALTARDEIIRQLNCGR